MGPGFFGVLGLLVEGGEKVHVFQRNFKVRTLHQS